MAFWLLSYSGKEHWNVDTMKVVRAPSAEAAIEHVSWWKQPKETWTAEPVEAEGDTETILGKWEGDHG